MSRSLNSGIDWFLFALVGFIWGSQFLFIKLAIALPPFALTTLRFLVATLMLAAVAATTRQRLPRDPIVLRGLLLLALLNNVIPFSLITWAEQGITSGMAAILNATMPLFTIVLAAMALREPITTSRLVGLTVGFAGVVILVGFSIATSGSESQLLGEVAVALASLSFACGAVYARRNPQALQPTVLALGQAVLALPILIVLSLATERPWTVNLDVGVLLAVIWLGVMASGVANLIWFRMLARWDATRSSLVSYVMPVVGVVLGVILLNEQFRLSELLGVLLVLGGIILANGGVVIRGRVTPALAKTASPPDGAPSERDRADSSQAT